MAISRIESYDIPRAGSWPACRAPWTFAPTRAALLIHDLQEYFLRPFEPESSPMVPMLSHVRRLHRAFSLAKLPVVFSAQPGEQSRDERGLLWDLWGPGIIQSPHQQGIAPAVSPAPGDVMLHKRRYSAFHDTELLELLRQRGCDQLIICGVYAHIGCLATATDGFMRGVQPFVVADATADFSEQDHVVALRQVARTCGVVTTTNELLTPLHESIARAAVAEFLESPADAISADDDLGDHGLDSIRFMQLVERLLPPDHGYDFEQIVEARSLAGFVRLMSPRTPQVVGAA